MRLAHGLPGSGKSAVLLWLTQYFKQVWQWTQGVHFVKVAFMNSMAANIDGSSIHSWGNIGFVAKDVGRSQPCAAQTLAMASEGQRLESVPTGRRGWRAHHRSRPPSGVAELWSARKADAFRGRDYVQALAEGRRRHKGTGKHRNPNAPYTISRPNHLGTLI